MRSGWRRLWGWSDKSALKMSEEICQHRKGCHFEAEHKCSACDRVFCGRHAAWSILDEKWLCAEDYYKKVLQYKRVAAYTSPGVFALVLVYFGVFDQLASSMQNCLGMCIFPFSFICIGAFILWRIHHRAYQAIFEKS